MALNLVLFTLPLLGRSVGEALGGLGHGPGQAPFWDGALFLAGVTVQLGLLTFVVVRDRRPSRT